jgi:hypothetical protein
MRRRPRAPGLLALAAAVAAGCGLQVQAPDLFLLTRTGGGQQKLTLLVNSGGTIRCNGSQARPLPDNLLLQARTLTGALNRDARRHLHLAPVPGSVYSYRVKLQSGTITFPDTAARTHSELARLELLAVQILGGPCHGLSRSG